MIAAWAYAASVFQSTLSQGERLNLILMTLLGMQFQSTLSQGERRFLNRQKGHKNQISIHALARRATLIIWVSPLAI